MRKDHFTQPALIDGNDFVRRVTALMEPLQRSLRALCEQLGRPKNTIVMQRQLGIGNTICWQIFRIVRADSMVSAARHAPLPQAMQQFIEAAERVGVPSNVLNDVRRASDAFRVFVKEHASDQVAFDTLIAGVDEEEGETIQIRHRRAAYRAESHIWGVQRDIYGLIAFVRRSQQRDRYDMAWLMCQFGYRRLRVNATATVFAFGDVTTWGDSMRSLDDDALSKYSAPLIPQFCSDPMPQLQRVPLPSGAVIYQLAETALGRIGSKDLTAGVICKSAGPVSPAGQLMSVLDQNFYCPTGRFVASVFLDRASFGSNVPTMISRLVGFSDGDPRGTPLPLTSPMVPYGAAHRATPCKDLPRYRDLVKCASQSTGWSLNEFDEYRMKLDYPIFASQMSLRFSVG